MEEWKRETEAGGKRETEAGKRETDAGTDF
jgi:hypothetical protein